MLKIDNIGMQECDKNKRVKKIEKELKKIPRIETERSSIRHQLVEKMDDVYNIIRLGNLAESVGLLSSTKSSYFHFDGLFVIKPGELRFIEILNSEEYCCKELKLRIFIINDVPGVKFEDCHCGVVPEKEQTQIMKDFLSQFDEFYETYLSYLEKETNIKDS